MNNKFEVRVIDSIKGKGIFATQNIKSGSVIFEEDAFICCQFSWNATYKYLACDNCMKPLETAEENARRLANKPDLVLPYPNCCTTDKCTFTQCDECQVKYCSNDCKQLANSQYHQTICIRSELLEQLNETWKHCHYPPETSTIMIIPRILATIMQSANVEETTAQVLRFCHSTVNESTELVHKLLGEKFIGQLDTLYNILLNCMQSNEISQLLTPEGFRSMLALVGTNGQGVGTSPISQWVKKCSELSLNDQQRKELDDFIDKLYESMEEHSGSFLNNEGVALYVLQSCCNHSCVPNAEPNFLHNNSRLSLMATRDIQAGEEICISYLDECSLERSRHSRQKTLKENYLFVCKCSKCIEQAGDPDSTSEEEFEEDEDMSD